MPSIYPSAGGPTRPCIRCGASLAFEQSQCQRCGILNPLPQGQPFSIPPQGQQGPDPRVSGSLWSGPLSPLPGQPNPPTGNGVRPDPNLAGPAWGAPPIQANLWNSNSPFPAPHQPSPSSQPLSNDTPFPQYPPQSSPNTFSPAFQQRGAAPSSWSGQPWTPPLAGHQLEDDEDDDGGKRPSLGVIALILVLLIALIGGGVFAGFSILKHGSSASSTPVPITIVTPSTTPLFRDLFQKNAASWDLTAPPGAKIALSGGKLVLESDNNEIFPVLVPGKTFSNFRLDVNGALTGGNESNGYGIYIRVASTQDSTLGLYYRLEVYGDGTFAVYKGIENPTGDTLSSTIKSDAASAAIYPHQQINHLTVIAVGTKITFEINGVVVFLFTDKSYKSGSIALFVSNVSGVPAGAQATFSNLAIFPAS